MILLQIFHSHAAACGVLNDHCAWLDNISHKQLFYVFPWFSPLYCWKQTDLILKYHSMYTLRSCWRQSDRYEGSLSPRKWNWIGFERIGNVLSNMRRCYGIVKWHIFVIVVVQQSGWNLTVMNSNRLGRAWQALTTVVLCFCYCFNKDILFLQSSCLTTWRSWRIWKIN